MEEPVSEKEAELKMIIADMEREFLDGCEDRLAEIDAALEVLRADRSSGENELLEIKRHVHSLKGLGATFGYSSITLMAHALEDYFESLFQPDDDGIHDVQHFIDRIREIVDSQSNWTDETVAQIVRDMPLKAKRRTVRKDGQALSVLVLMPKGLQRKIVATELSEFGFHVLIAENSFDAIEKGVRLQPDLFMSSVVNEDISGIELAGVFYAIETTESRPFLLVSSTPLDEIETRHFPPTVTVLEKGGNFARDLMAFFKEQNYSTN